MMMMETKTTTDGGKTQAQGQAQTEGNAQTTEAENKKKKDFSKYAMWIGGATLVVGILGGMYYLYNKSQKEKAKAEEDKAAEEANK